MFKPLQDLILERWGEWDLGPKPKDISFIRRTSTWLGDAGKVVFYVFRRGETVPTLIAKTVGSPEFGESIRKEAQNINRIRNTISKAFQKTIPQPLELSELNGIPVYFEKAIPGTTLPERFAASWFEKSKKKLVREAVQEISWWLENFHNAVGVKKVPLDSAMVEKQFISPLKRFKSVHDLTVGEQSFLSHLQETAKSLEGKAVAFSPVHGDFWGGSLLWGTDGKMRVIDWEFFERRGLPLQDILYLAIHPGFVIRNKGEHCLLEEFMSLFEESYFTEAIRFALWEQARNVGIDTVESLKFLMATTLIKLSLERDPVSKNYSKDSWRMLFHYFVENREKCQAISQ